MFLIDWGNLAAVETAVAESGKKGPSRGMVPVYEDDDDDDSLLNL